MKEIIALQEYTDKYVSFYEGEIRNIQDGIADKLIEEGIVAEHSSDGNDGSSDTEILSITDDDIIACADENNNVKWSDVLAYVIRKKIGIISSGLAPMEYIVSFSKPYPNLFIEGQGKRYYCLNVYFQGEDTSAKVGYSKIYVPSGVYEHITEETQPGISFNINNILYHFIKLKGNWHAWEVKS